MQWTESLDILGSILVMMQFLHSMEQSRCRSWTHKIVTEHASCSSVIRHQMKIGKGRDHTLQNALVTSTLFSLPAANSSTRAVAS